MDWKTFFSRLIDSIVWPITIFLLVVLLKKPLIELALTLKKLKFKDLELEFGRELVKVQQLEKEEPQAPKDDFIKDLAERYKELADISPQACILDAWKELEVAARNAVSRTFPHPDEIRNIHTPMSIGNMLLKREILNKRQLEIFTRLRLLRNKAAHSVAIPLKKSEAVEYATSVLHLVLYLNKFRVE